MKILTLALAAMVAVTTLEVSHAAVDREAKKAATEWVKNDIKKRKSTLTLLKRVKDERSADKSAKALLKLYAEPTGKSTGMGVAGPPQKPSGEEMDEVLEKNQRTLEKLQTGIDKELERIGELNLESSTLQQAIEEIGKE